ncbi:AMP-binding protein [Streptomyces sp. NPDC008238]
MLRRYPHRIAFSWDGGSLTYAGVLDLIGRMQAVFAAYGLRPGQCAALLFGNRAENWCAAVAAQAFGLTIITWLHPLSSLEDHVHQLNDAAADSAGRELPDRPRYLEVGPISHVAGSNIVPTFSRGGTVHLLEGFSPEAVLAAIERERVNVALLAPQ